MVAITSLIPTLLQAIVRLDGEAVVLHTGERPYVVTPSGRVDLATRGLTQMGVANIVSQLLPVDARSEFDRVGAARFELPASDEFPGDRFTIVASREGDDVWAEMRRAHEAPAPPSAPDDSLAQPAGGELEPGAGVGHDTSPVTVEDCLRIAASSGASALYLLPGVAPTMRIGGRLTNLTPAPTVRDLAFAGADPGAGTTDWFADVAGVGRVHGLTFIDRLGAGAVFHFAPARVATLEELGLAADAPSLVPETGGLVLVSGPRGAAAVVVSALIDHLNRTRGCRIVAIESAPAVVHAGLRALVSQREVPGGAEDVDAECAAARAALREDPDVLVLPALRNADLASIALDAAAEGRLVIASLVARDARGAVDRFVSCYPREARGRIQSRMARDLVAVIAPSGLETGQGATVARELLLTTPEAAALIEDGRIGELAALALVHRGRR